MILMRFIIPRGHRQSPVVPGRPPQLPAVPHLPLQPPTLKCLTLQGPLSSTITAILRFLGRGWTAFWRPIWSRALGSPPAGPYGAPGLLRTLNLIQNERRPDLTRICLQVYSLSNHSYYPHLLSSNMYCKVNRNV